MCFHAGQSLRTMDLLKEPDYWTQGGDTRRTPERPRKDDAANKEAAPSARPRVIGGVMHQHP